MVKGQNSKPYLKFKYLTGFSAHVLRCLDTIVEAHYKGIYTSEKRGLLYVKYYSVCKLSETAGILMD